MICGNNRLAEKAGSKCLSVESMVLRKAWFPHSLLYNLEYIQAAQLYVGKETHRYTSAHFLQNGQMH